MEVKKIRVLVVYHYIAKYREPIFNSLAAYSGDREFEFASDTASPTDIKLASSTFFRNKKFKKITNLWIFGGLWQVGLWGVIKRGSYDEIIFLGDPSFYSTWLAAAILRFSRVKVFFWTHGLVRTRGIKDSMKLVYYRFADGLLLYGDGARANLTSRGVVASKLFTIYNSLDYVEQKRIRLALDESEIAARKQVLFKEPTAFQLVFVGRLTKQKKINRIVEMVAELREEGRCVNLLLIGDGECRDELQELILRYGLESQVLIYGQTYDEDELALLLMGSQLCISPGEVGLTAMHALAYGVPIVTHSNPFTQMPEFEAILDGATGFLFPDGNFNAMKAAVVNYLDNPIKDVFSNCVDVIEKKYNVDVQRERILSALTSVKLK